MKLQFAKYPDDGKINSNQAGFHKITGCATSRWGLDLNLNYHKPSTRPIECQQTANVVNAENYFGNRDLPQKNWSWSFERKQNFWSSVLLCHGRLFKAHARLVLESFESGLI